MCRYPKCKHANLGHKQWEETASIGGGDSKFITYMPQNERRESNFNRLMIIIISHRDVFHLI